MNIERYTYLKERCISCKNSGADVTDCNKCEIHTHINVLEVMFPEKIEKQRNEYGYTCTLL